MQGAGATTTIENNIIAVAAGPAESIAPTAEAGFVSDYNFFDITGTGAIASWEGVSYTALATWYYATGEDQHSQLGNPEFINPTGTSGVLGFGPPIGSTQVIDNSSASGFAVTGTWTEVTGSLIHYTGNTGTIANFTGLTNGATYELAQETNGGAILSIGTPFVESGTTFNTPYESSVNGTVTVAALLPYVGFDNNSLETAAGSGATATWTFTGRPPAKATRSAPPRRPTPSAPRRPTRNTR